MEKRIDMFSKGGNALKSLFAAGVYNKQSKIDPVLRELVDVRVSQLNKCAYCLDMHWKEARAHGETEQRLYGLSAWEESPYYTEKERAGLAWAEALTACVVNDEVYRLAAAHFDEEELMDLTMIVTTINSWNRINVAFTNEAVGTYRVGQFG